MHPSPIPSVSRFAFGDASRVAAGCVSCFASGLVSGFASRLFPGLLLTASRRFPGLLLTASLVVTLGLQAPPAAGTATASLLPAIDHARDLREREVNTAPVLRKHYVEVSPGVFLAVKGQRERRQVRMARWIDGLEGDRAAVFGEQGFPTFRHLELQTGRSLEIWSYPATGVTYVFEGNRLLARRPF